MKIRSPLVMAVWSVAALLPATVFLIAGLVFFIGAIAAIADGKFFLPGGGVDYEFLYLSLSYVTGAYAIWEFWALAIATIRERPVPSSRWRFAIACGCISSVGASLVGGIRVFVVVVLPVCMLVGWLLSLQRQRL